MSFDGTSCGFIAAIGKACKGAGFFLPSSVLIAEAQDLESIPAVGVGTHTVSTDIVFDVGKFFYTWLTTEGGAVMNYASIGQKGSQAFKNTLTIYVPISRDEVLYQVNQVLNDDFIIVPTDTNGVKYLFGTEQNPMRIAEGGIQGVKDGENDGTTITFENTGPTYKIYTGATPTS